MERADVLLATMSVAGGKAFSPVQIQKAMFLLSRELSDVFDEGENYDFVPYSYGPFDSGVYDDLESLAISNLITISDGMRYKEYGVTDDGLKQGEASLNSMAPQQKEYVCKVSDFVRRLSFSQLVSAIYKAYPEMKENSIFMDGNC